MKRKVFMTVLGVLALAGAVSCNNKGKEGNDPKEDSSASLWKMKNYPIEKVEVYSGETLLETFSFTYDKNGCVSTLVRTDNIKGTTLLNLTYSYSGEGDMTYTGKYYAIASDRTVHASLDASKRTVTWKGDWSGAWPCTLSYGSDGTILKTEADLDYTSAEGYYSSSTTYQEQYTASGGDVKKVLTGTDIATKTSRPTTSASSSDLEINYTYTNKVDNQNFGVFLMNGDFPIWFAKELPGCKHLISGMSMKRGELTLPQSFTVDYTLNIDGDIETATRTDYNAGEAVLVRTYKFTYL